MLRIARYALALLVLFLLLFPAAGRRDLPWFWTYWAMFSAAMIYGLTAINDEGLQRERRRPGPGGIDRGLRFAVGPVVLLQFLVAGIDVGRLHATPPLPFAVHAAGLLGALAGYVLVLRSMAANTFFSPVVRIQAERGHRVITGGPYRFVRHPGYLGMLLLFLSSGLALGSLWSLIPAFALGILILRRARLEDRYLLANLEGYRAYSRSVRFRLIPWVW